MGTKGRGGGGGRSRVSARARAAYNRAKVEQKRANRPPVRADAPTSSRPPAVPTPWLASPVLLSLYPVAVLVAIPWATDLMAVVKAIPPVCVGADPDPYRGTYVARPGQTFTFIMHCIYTCVSYRKDLESQGPRLARRVAVTLGSSFAGSLVAAVVFGQVPTFVREVAGKLPYFLACWAVVDWTPPEWFGALKLREGGPAAAARSAVYLSEGLYKHSGLLKAWKITPALRGCGPRGGAAAGLGGLVFCAAFGGVRGGASTLLRGVDFACYGQLRKAADTSKTEIRRYALLSLANLWGHAALCAGAAAAAGAGGAAARWAWGHPVALAQRWASGSPACAGAAGAGGWLERFCRGPEAALVDVTQAGVLIYVLAVYLQKARPPSASLRRRAGEVRSMAAAVATMQRAVGKPKHD